MKTFKAELTAALTSALAAAPTRADQVTYGDKITIPFNVPAVHNVGKRGSEWTPGVHFQLTLFNSREAIQAAIDGTRRIPGSSPLPCPKVRSAEPDYANAALDIYGDAATAVLKLQAQLDNAADLGIESKQAWKLEGLISELRDRAEATTDPALQRTVPVAKLIENLRVARLQAETVRRAVGAAAAVAGHAEVPALVALIAEHQAVNAERGIENVTGAQSPLLFNPSDSRDVKLVAGSYKRIQNTKHNVAIRAAIERIACNLLVWNRRTQKVDFSRYQPWESYAAAA